MKSWFITDNLWYIFEFVTKLQYTCQFYEKCNNPSCQITDTETDTLEPSKMYENSKIVHCHSLEMDIHIP